MTAPATAEQAPPITLKRAESPANPSGAYRRMQNRIRLARDVMEGTETLRLRGTEYLPKHPAESQDAYQDRLKIALFYNAFKRTLNGLVGMVFRRDPVLDEGTPKLVATDFWENIDNSGTDGPSFLKQVSRDGLIAGHAGILVDYPIVPLVLQTDGTPRALTPVEQREQGYRPFWVHYAAEDILAVRFEVDKGRAVLSYVALRDRYTAQVRYGEQEVVEYRVFRRGLAEFGIPASYELWREVKNDEVMLVSEGTIAPLVEIPFVLLFAERVAQVESCPPLADLAYVNIAHYQVWSDRRQALHLGSVPVLVFMGRPTDSPQTIVGPNVAFDIPIGGDAKWIEPEGNAFAASHEELQDLEQRMAALGLAMLQRQTRAAETAEAKSIDKAESDSALSSYAREIQNAANRCLRLHGLWYGMSEEEARKASISVSRDFLDLVLSPEQVRAYADLHTAGKISLETLWAMLEVGEVLPEEFKPSIERARLEEEALSRPPLLPAGDELAAAMAAAAAAGAEA